MNTFMQYVSKVLDIFLYVPTITFFDIIKQWRILFFFFGGGGLKNFDDLFCFLFFFCSSEV